MKVGLVGRERELAELRGALDDVAGGHGRVWLVGGEAGIGKTRLLEAVSEAVGPTEVRVLWGRCWEGGGAPAYWPWAQVLRGAIADVGADALAARLGPGADDVASLVPEVAVRLPGVEPAPISEAPGGRFRLFESVAAFLVRTAAEAPLLVILDDLHAADEASLLLLAFVAAEAPRAHLAVVGAYRDAEVASSPRLTTLLSGAARYGQRLSLGGLDRAGTETLFEAATDAPAPPEVVARVHEVTEGNPFLVKELARVAAWRRLRPGDRLPLPEEAHAIVARRLAPLSEPVRRVLAAAAVLGRDFDVTSLAGVVGQAPIETLDALGEARRQGVVEEAGVGRWSFAHALLREVLVDGLAPSTRAELHRRAAEVIEARPGTNAGATLASVAHHRYEAARTGEDTVAADACAAAGDQAMAALAFEDAAGWYERALEVLPLFREGGNRHCYDLLMALGQARFRASQFDEAHDAYGRALDRARALGSAELLADAALGLSTFRRLERPSVAFLEEALAGLPEADSALRARLLLSLGAGLLVTRPDGWRGWAAMCDEGLAMARRAGDPDALLVVLLHWHRCQWEWDPLGVEERLAVAEEALWLSAEAGRAGEWARYLVRSWRFCDLLDRGEVAAARSEADDASREAQRLRLPFCTSVATFMQAALALLRGDLNGAQSFVRGGYTPLEDFDDRLGWFTVAIHRQRGELLEARQALEDVCPPASSAFGPYWRLAYRAEAALSAAELDEDYARAEFEEVVSDALSLSGPPLDPDILVRLAQACWLLAAADQAEALYQLLRPYRGRLVNYQVVGTPLGAADRHLGQLATLLGRHREAEAHFEAAHTQHRRWGAPSFLAHGQADHARMLLARGTPADRARAAALTAEAVAGYRTVGMAYYEERVSRLMAEAGARPTFDTLPAVPDRHVLRQEGEYWCADYGGIEVRVRDSRGVRYLVRLLRAPGRELHVLDLTGGPQGFVMEDDAGTLLDSAAKAAYRRRLDELAAEAEEADNAHDMARAERVGAERDFLVGELAAATGLGGRDRVAASTTERARQTVSKGVRAAIARLGKANPALGRHLEATVRTGTYCIYEPDPRVPIRWEES